MRDSFIKNFKIFLKIHGITDVIYKYIFAAMQRLPIGVILCGLLKIRSFSICLNIRRIRLKIRIENILVTLIY